LIITTGVTCGVGTAYPSGASEFTLGFIGVRSLVLCVFFVDRCLSHGKENKENSVLFVSGSAKYG
jgi:hypothetical protein